MKSSHNMLYPEEKVHKIGFVILCLVLKEILNSGMRIAVMKELKCIKMLIDPSHGDQVIDLDLLRILDEPHVKLASELADFTCYEILEPYALITNLHDHIVLADKPIADMGFKLAYRFLFFRENPRRRDRYINFTKVLCSAQKVVYEFLKLMLTGETRMHDSKYRTNYSAGRLKALTVDNTDSVVGMMVRLIEKLREGEKRSVTLTVF